jgi:hypothetical protein
MTQSEAFVTIFTPYKTIGKKRVYHPQYFSHGKVFKFDIPLSKYKKRG